MLGFARTRNRIVPVKPPGALATDVTLVPPVPVPTTAKSEDWCVPGGGSPNGSGSEGEVHPASASNPAPSVATGQSGPFI